MRGARTCGVVMTCVVTIDVKNVLIISLEEDCQDQIAWKRHARDCKLDSTLCACVRVQLRGEHACVCRALVSSVSNSSHTTKTRHTPLRYATPGCTPVPLTGVRVDVNIVECTASMVCVHACYDHSSLLYLLLCPLC